MLFSLRCFIMLLTKICSIHFAMMQVSETGRQLLGLYVSLFENWGNVCFLLVIRNLASFNGMLNIISRMGEISWLSSFKTVGGYQIWACGFMWFQVGE